VCESGLGVYMFDESTRYWSEESNFSGPKKTGTSKIFWVYQNSRQRK